MTKAKNSTKKPQKPPQFAPGGGLLTFSVLQDRLLDESKTQTIRKLATIEGTRPEGEAWVNLLKESLDRKRFQVGSPAHIHWKSPRTRRHNCDQYKMGLGRITYVRPAELGPDGITLYAKDLTQTHQLNKGASDVIAIKDGFRDYAEMWAWFDQQYKLDRNDCVFVIYRFEWVNGPRWPPKGVQLSRLPLSAPGKRNQTRFVLPERR